MMKSKILMVLVLALSLSACGKVPAGHKGVKVKLYGSSKGVDAEAVGVGRYWLGINTELYKFPTFTQNYVWTKSRTEGSKTDQSISFETVEGMSVNTDIGISYHIEPNKVVDVFQKYRLGVDEITGTFLRNMVRDSFIASSSKLPIESVYGTGKVDLINEVQLSVQEQVAEIGIVIEKVYYAGKMRLPQPVVDALNAKIEATQRAQQRENEIRETKAEAEKKIAEAKGIAESTLIQAEAISKGNKLKAQSYTQPLLDAMWIEKWNGITPRMITGDDAGLMINTGN